MTVRLIIRDGAFRKVRPSSNMPQRVYNLTEPSPAICGSGIRGSFISGHFLQDDGEPTTMSDDIPKVPRPGRPPQMFDQAAAKPPYRVPLMSEIRKIKPNGFTVVSTFAGAGGSSTGYRLAGFRVLWANEFVPIAQESYRANCAPHTVVDGRSIKEVSAADVLRATGLEVGELDVLDGSPPCQAFSTAGKRDKGWGTEREYEHGAKQKNEELFFDYIRLRDGLMPRTFVAENVSGLVKGVAKGFFLEILKELRRGYRVVAPLLDAQWLGVPQTRQRIVFVGVREDLGIDPPKIAPLPYRYSVRDALPWLGGGTMSSGHQFAERPLELDEPGKTVLANEMGGSYRRARVVHDTRGSFKSGGTITDRPSVTIMSSAFDAHHFQVEGAPPPPEVVHDPKGKRNKRRSIGDEPSPTIVATPNCATHYFVEGNRRPNVQLVANDSFVEKLISADNPSPTIMAGGPGKTSGHVVEAPSLEGQAIGEEYDRLNPGQQSDKYFSLVRAAPGEPCPTITASAGNASTASVAHPTEKRKFTILEVKRLCSFSDDFILHGSYGQQWERLGNSVPPLMMEKVAIALRDQVLIPARKKFKWPHHKLPSDSGSRSKKESPTNAGRGKPHSPAGATGTSGTAKGAGSSHRTSSHSRKSSADGSAPACADSTLAITGPAAIRSKSGPSRGR